MTIYVSIEKNAICLTVGHWKLECVQRLVGKVWYVDVYLFPPREMARRGTESICLFIRNVLYDIG